MSQIEKCWEAVKRLTDWPQVWHTSADPCGNEYAPNKWPLEIQGGGGTWGILGVERSQVLGSCQTAGPIGTNFGSRLRIHLGIHLGMDTC